MKMLMELRQLTVCTTELQRLLRGILFRSEYDLTLASRLSLRGAFTATKEHS